MADASKLLGEAAREAVQDITERYDGYHTHLVDRFAEVLRIQREHTYRVAERTIEDLVASFANEVGGRCRSVSG